MVKKLKLIIENPAPFIFDDGCCCIYPCCVRRHLYDFPDETFGASHETIQDDMTEITIMGSRNRDKSVIVAIHSNDERQPILKQPLLNKDIASRTNESEIVHIQSSEAIVNQPSNYSEIASQTSSKTIAVTVHSNEAANERQSILNQPSDTPRYGACS